MKKHPGDTHTHDSLYTIYRDTQIHTHTHKHTHSLTTLESLNNRHFWDTSAWETHIPTIHYTPHTHSYTNTQTHTHSLTTLESLKLLITDTFGTHLHGRHTYPRFIIHYL